MQDALDGLDKQIDAMYEAGYSIFDWEAGENVDHDALIGAIAWAAVAVQTAREAQG